MTAKEAIDSYFNVYRKSEFPVVERGTYYKKLLSAWSCCRKSYFFSIPEENRANVKVSDIMVDKAKLAIMRPADTADQALRKMIRENTGRISVCEENVPNAAAKEIEEIAVKYKDI
jgi:hypothetical protein